MPRQTAPRKQSAASFDRRTQSLMNEAIMMVEMAFPGAAVGLVVAFVDETGLAERPQWRSNIHLEDAIPLLGGLVDHLYTTLGTSPTKQ